MSYPANEFVGPAITEKPVKFRDPSINLSREMPPEAAFSTVFGCNFRPEVDRDVISGMLVDPTSVKVLVKSGDSMSNRSRYIRLPHFVPNDAGRRILWQGQNALRRFA